VVAVADQLSAPVNVFDSSLVFHAFFECERSWGDLGGHFSTEEGQQRQSYDGTCGY